MSYHAWVSLIILIVSAIFFLTRWLRLEIVALAIPVALYFTGAVPNPSEVLSGFGNHAVIAIAAVFVLSAGIQESGVAAWLARLVQRAGGTSEITILALVCTVVAVLSAFMSNAATVAVLLPVVVALGRRASIPPSRILMPMGFAAILGGNLTLIGTSSNLLVSDYLRRTTGEPLGMFEFAMIGLPIAASGIIYILTIGRRLIPDHEAGAVSGSALPEQLVRDYGLASNLARVRVGQASDLIGQSLVEAGMGRDYQLAILAVSRRGSFGERWFMPGPDYRFLRGDDLYIEGPELECWRLIEDTHSRMGLPGEHQVEKVLDHGFAMAEISIPPRSSMIGKTLREINFRTEFGVSAMSIWRGGEALTGDLANLQLEPGDAMLLAGPLDRVRKIEGGDDLVLVTHPADVRDFTKAPVAVLCLAIALLPPLLGWAPLAMSAMAGALMMVLTKAVPAERAGSFMEWRVLALIVGTIPLGIALERHGVAQMVANGLVQLAPDLGIPGVLTGLYLMAALVSTTCSNAAAAVILTPVAASAAEALGMKPSSPLLAVAFGCSCAFIVPFAHQCNLMVVSIGGYKPKDFMLVGSGLSIVVATVAITLLTWM
ncbi:MAG: SLC13 family permease [Planctomycetes bacterium]|nr:SLC13 family permease [Planctomycetota bacterium]